MRSPWPGVVRIPIRLTQDKVEFWFEFCNFAVRFSVYSLACFQLYGAKLLNADCWDRGKFSLSCMGAILAIKKALLLDADWLSTLALSWFPASNRFWKGISETHRFWFWSKCGYFILTWKNIDMQQSTVFRWKRKRIFFGLKRIDSQPEWVWVGSAVVARCIELQNFMAAKLKVDFLILLRVVNKNWKSQKKKLFT